MIVVLDESLNIYNNPGIEKKSKVIWDASALSNERVCEVASSLASQYPAVVGTARYASRLSASRIALQPQRPSPASFE